MAVLEWRSIAEGIRIVEPGGKSMMSFRSQRTKCPPCLGSNQPNAVNAHHPNGGLPEVGCAGKQRVRGPEVKCCTRKDAVCPVHDEVRVVEEERTEV